MNMDRFMDMDTKTYMDQERDTETDMGADQDKDMDKNTDTKRDKSKQIEATLFFLRFALFRCDYLEQNEENRREYLIL